MIETKNAVIKSVRISNADHGCLSIWLDLDYGGSGQAFGGFSLFRNGKTHKDSGARCGHFIDRVLKVAGVTNWDQVAGKTIRVLADHSSIEGIGHIVEDIWFRPKVDFANE